jgi:hypothetical protein
MMDAAIFDLPGTIAVLSAGTMGIDTVCTDATSLAKSYIRCRRPKQAPICLIADARSRAAAGRSSQNLPRAAA